MFMVLVIRRSNDRQTAKVAGFTFVKDLTPAEEDTIRTIVEKQYKTEGDLRRDCR